MDGARSGVSAGLWQGRAGSWSPAAEPRDPRVGIRLLGSEQGRLSVGRCGWGRGSEEGRRGTGRAGTLCTKLDNHENARMKSEKASLILMNLSLRASLPVGAGLTFSWKRIPAMAYLRQILIPQLPTSIGAFPFRMA